MRVFGGHITDFGSVPGDIFSCRSSAPCISTQFTVHDALLTRIAKWSPGRRIS